MRIKNKQNAKERGFVLVMMAIMAVVLFAFMGMSVDMGRMFIAKHEAQAFADSAALQAALQLDGAQSGALAGTTAVGNSKNKWNLGTQTFASTNYQVDYSTSSAGPWVLAASVPASASGYRYARVQANVTLPLYFMAVLVPVTTTTVKSQSIAGQTSETTLYEGGFPFTPMSFDPSVPTVGFTTDVQYTIRYPAGKNTDPCAGDIGVHSKDNSDRGYWGDNSAAVIAQRIEDDYQSGAVATVGQDIDLTGGAKTTESDYVNARSAQDPDQTSMTWAAYKTSTHNGRRLVVMPITNYATGIDLGYATFLLLPSGNYDHTGNSPWCAVYVGAGVLDGTTGGASSTAGAYQVTLVK